MPKLLMIHIVFHAVKLLSFFPMKEGILDTLSPITIMSSEMLDYKKHLRLQLGQYCQVHQEDTPRNSLRPRTKGAISLRPSGNLQGGFKFMALNTEEDYLMHLGRDSHVGYGDCTREYVGEPSAQTIDFY
jgi:hypothetical protein